jgi:hypothetical protein
MLRYTTTQKLHSGFLRIFGAGVKKQVFEDINDQNTVFGLKLTRVLCVEITVFWNVKCVLWRKTLVLMMEAKCSSERSLRMYKPGRRHMSEHRNLNQ